MGLRSRDLLRVFDGSPTDLLHCCAKLLVNILYVIYIGIIISNAEASLMSDVSEIIKCWAGLNIAFNKVDNFTSIPLLTPQFVTIIFYRTYSGHGNWCLLCLLFPCVDIAYRKVP